MAGHFNPRKHAGGSGGSRMDAGRFVLAVKTYERRNGPSGSYVRAEVVGVSPQVRGGRLFTTLSFAPQALWRFAALCEAVDYVEEGHLGSDDYLRETMGRPFKADVVKAGKYHDIARFLPWDGEDDEMLNHIHGWSSPEGTGTITRVDGYYDDFGFGDDDGYEQAQETRHEPPARRPLDEPPPIDDDDEDIPF